MGRGDFLSNREIAEQFLSAMMSSDLDVMADCLSSAVVWHPPTSTERQFGGEVRGLKSVMSFLTENPEKFYEPGSRSAEILHVVSEHDFVSIHFNFVAKPRIGGRLCTCANWLFQLSDDRITDVWEVLDMAEWNNAVLAT